MFWDQSKWIGSVLPKKQFQTLIHQWALATQFSSPYVSTPLTTIFLHLSKTKQKGKNSKLWVKHRWRGVQKTAIWKHFLIICLFFTVEFLSRRKELIKEDLADILFSQSCLFSELSSPGICSLMQQLQTVHAELRLLTRRMHRTDRESELVRDWKFAARVIDRLCLISFTVCLVVMTCAILFSAPYLSAWENQKRFNFNQPFPAVQKLNKR